MDHAKIFEAIGQLRPGKTGFNLSFKKKFDADIGMLIPLFCEECIPGDIWEIDQENLVRCQPIVVPIMHKIEVFSHTFFVPYRLLWKDQEKWLTGGVTGDLEIPIQNFGQRYFDDHTFWYAGGRYSIWDYLGFRVIGDTNNQRTVRHKPSVNDMPWRAYWRIWMDYYRDSNFQLNWPGTSLEIGQDFYDQIDSLNQYINFPGLTANPHCNRVAYRGWAKDYFVSALASPQRGTSPIIPLQGSVKWLDDLITDAAGTGLPFPVAGGPTSNELFFSSHSIGSAGNTVPTTQNDRANAAHFWKNFLNSNTGLAAGIDINDLREAVQIQKWMERNARAGFQYHDFIKARWGTRPGDERLQRPQYLGGTRQPIIITEVLQTSQTTQGNNGSPQGNMAGHGISLTEGSISRYHVQEPGIIMSIMSIMPEAVYQDGIPKQWMKTSRFDYPMPEFMHLSEQPIRRGELFWTGDPNNDDILFGYQGIWDEYRINRNIVCGKLASELKEWTLSRIFGNAPVLNETFITTENFSRTRRDAWAVPGVEGDEQRQFIIEWHNLMTCLRPLPYIAEPGMMDHF
jgi:hypothetical protein